MNHYNKPQGLESALHAELSAKRQKLSESQPVALTQAPVPASQVVTAGSTALSQKTRCSYNITSSTKCGEVCIPLTKFCIKHVMNDPSQVNMLLHFFVFVLSYFSLKKGFVSDVRR